MKHWFGILGRDSDVRLRTFAGSNDIRTGQQFFGNNWALSVEETVKEFVPVAPIWCSTGGEKIGIALHGVVFPKEIGVDAFMDNPASYCRDLLSRCRDDFASLPLRFYNGAFVGLILRPVQGDFYLFNSFLNHIPLYYSLNNGNLYFSTCMSLLSQCLRDSFHHNERGILEYLEYGTNITENTFIANVKCLPKASVLRYNKQLVTKKRYYKLPKERMHYGRNELLEKTHSLWSEGVSKLYSNKIRIGLGLTGGVDSRLIYAEWQHKDSLLAFTGTHRYHPDYVVACMLACKLGFARRHVLEDYGKLPQDEIIASFKDYLKIVDNPLTLNDIVIKKQADWRRIHNIEIQLHGIGGEVIGGELYQSSRSSLPGIMRSILPFRYTKLASKGPATYRKLINLALRNFVGRNALRYFKNHNGMREYSESFDCYIQENMNAFINTDDSCEDYLERFRALFKHPNLLYYRFLASRERYELVSPYFSIPFIDFALSVPLHHRHDRKLLLALLNRYYPEASSVVLVGSLFRPNAPFIVHKLVKPFVKGLNTMGFSLSFAQPHMTGIRLRSNPLDIYLNGHVKAFIANVIRGSELINSSVYPVLDHFVAMTKLDYGLYRREWEKVWRLFCVALAEKRFTMKPSQYSCFIDTQWDNAQRGSRA